MPPPAAVGGPSGSDEPIALPVNYLSSASHPHDTRPGSLVHFFLAAVDRADGSAEVRYLAVLDDFCAVTDNPGANSHADRGLGATMDAAVSSTLQRVLDVGAVSDLMFSPSEHHFLTTNRSKPDAAAIFDGMPAASIVPILPMLLCVPNSPIVYLVTVPGHEAVQHVATMAAITRENDEASASVDWASGLGSSVRSSSQGSARGGGGKSHAEATQFTATLRCQQFAPTLLQRNVHAPSTQHLLFERFRLAREHRARAAAAAVAAIADATSTGAHLLPTGSSKLSAASPSQQNAGGAAPRVVVTSVVQRGRSHRATASIMRLAVIWWTLITQRSLEKGTSAKAPLPHQAVDEESDPAQLAFARRAVLEAAFTFRRQQLLTVDTSAGAAAIQEIHSQALLTAVGSTLREKLFRAVGAVTDLVGAAMSYQPNWTLVAHPSFGRAMRVTHFGLREGITMLDGTRYGMLPLPVREARRKWERCVQVDPVLWRFKAFPPRLETVIAKLGQRLSVFPADLQLFPTINHAMATVLRSLPLVPGDKIVVFGPTAHSALLSHLMERSGVVVLTVTLFEPLGSDSDIVEQLQKVLRVEHPRVVLMQHLTLTGRALPLARMVAESTDMSAISIVDGTDALGNLKFNMAQLGSDFYLTRLDGFFFCPCGMSLLHAHPRRQRAIRTLTVSYFYGSGYQKEWTYTGLMDMTTWIAVTQALQFQKYLCAGYKEYLTFLANEAHKLLCTMWNVEPIVPLPIQGGIFGVRLPGTLGSSPADALHLQAILATRKVHVGIIPLLHRGKSSTLAARVVCHVYTDLVDIKQLALAVLQHAVTTV
jgi:isopenicillin-N epimerase